MQTVPTYQYYGIFDPTDPRQEAQLCKTQFNVHRGFLSDLILKVSIKSVKEAKLLHTYFHSPLLPVSLKSIYLRSQLCTCGSFALCKKLIDFKAVQTSTISGSGPYSCCLYCLGHKLVYLGHQCRVPLCQIKALFY